MAVVLRQGSLGKDVRALQNALNFHMRLELPLKVDGIFGPRTDERTRRFQKLMNLSPDGIVGPLTQAALFELETVEGQMLYLPTLSTDPLFPNRQGIRPPRLIPRLQLPSTFLPTPIIFGPTLTLDKFQFGNLPPVGGPMVLDFKLTVPVRKDPGDPSVIARTNLVSMIDQIPINAKFRAMIISLVPNPEKKIGYPSPGFDWGVDIPSFNPLKPEKIGFSGNAKYLIHITGKPGSPLPFVTFGAWGDAKAELNYESKQGSTGFTVKFSGQGILGFQGTF